MQYKRSLLILLMLALSLLPVSLAKAASTDTVAVKVTIASTLSVNITETEYQFGTLNAGSTTVSATGATVTNNGSGVNETYSLSLTNPSGWTASQTAAGSNTYVLNAALSNLVTGITWSAANHALSTTPVVCSATKFAGDQTGVSVPYNATRKLWFQFLAPTTSTVATEQAITVTVTAQAG